MNNEETMQNVYICSNKNDPPVSSFSSYLAAALNRHGIDVVSEKPNPELENAQFFGIKLFLVIFSNPNSFFVEFAENLVKLLEFVQENGHVVVPVFYDTSVSVMKHHLEMFGETFSVLENSFSADQVTQWRRMLVETMELQGHEYNDEFREESEFIEEIAQDVSEKLYPTEHIGTHKILPELENLLCEQPWGHRTLGIFGDPGIGKTTLVKAALRRMSGGYDASRFIIISNEKIIEHLSHEDFREIPMEKFDLDIQDAEPCYRQKRLFIALDDVRNEQDVKAFLAEFDRFGPGSLLIITSRERKVLEKCHVNEIYELKGLNKEDSLKLFTRCFFGEGAIDEKLLRLSMREIESCGGNPSTIRSYVEKMKSMKTVNLKPLFSFRATRDSFTKNLKQHFLFTAAHNYQSADLEMLPGVEIGSHKFEYTLSNLGTPYLDLNSVQHSLFCATSHNYLPDLKELPRLDLPSHVLKSSLPSDPRIAHFDQEFMLSCELNKPWQGCKSFQIGEIHFQDCTRIPVTDQLKPPQVLNLRGCIEIKSFQEFVRTIREFVRTDKILQWRLQTNHLVPLCNSANEAGSHLYFDFTFSWSIPTTKCNQIDISPESPLRSWKDVLFALLNLTASKAKKILSRIEGQLYIYSVWIEKNHPLYRNTSYRSALVHRFIRNITTSTVRSKQKLPNEIFQLRLQTSSCD